MKITTLWLGVKVLNDGTLSDALEDTYVALEEADWMALTDEGGWPRPCEPGDLVWAPFPVLGVSITLHDGCLIAERGEVKIVLNDVDVTSVFPMADHPFASIAAILTPLDLPNEGRIERLDTGLRGTFGQGGTN